MAEERLYEGVYLILMPNTWGLQHPQSTSSLDETLARAWTAVVLPTWTK